MEEEAKAGAEQPASAQIGNKSSRDLPTPGTSKVHVACSTIYAMSHRSRLTLTLAAFVNMWPRFVHSDGTWYRGKQQQRWRPVEDPHRSSRRVRLKWAAQALTDRQNRSIIFT